MRHRMPEYLVELAIVAVLWSAVFANLVVSKMSIPCSAPPSCPREKRLARPSMQKYNKSSASSRGAHTEHRNPGLA
jgi:hypothetical protein